MPFLTFSDISSIFSVDTCLFNIQWSVQLFFSGVVDTCLFNVQWSVQLFFQWTHLFKFQWSVQLFFSRHISLNNSVICSAFSKWYTATPYLEQAKNSYVLLSEFHVEDPDWVDLYWKGLLDPYHYYLSKIQRNFRKKINIFIILNDLIHIWQHMPKKRLGRIQIIF